MKFFTSLSLLCMLITLSSPVNTKKAILSTTSTFPSLISCKCRALPCKNGICPGKRSIINDASHSRKKRTVVCDLCFQNGTRYLGLGSL